jgi:hypothetical protein
MYFLITCSLVICSALSAILGVKIDDDDKVSDWLNQKENSPSLIQFTDVSTEKMIRFFKKLDWLRRQYQQDRVKSNHPRLFQPKRGCTPFAEKSVEENDYSTVQHVLSPPLLFPDDDHKTYCKGNEIF